MNTEKKLMAVLLKHYSLHEAYDLVDMILDDDTYREDVEKYLAEIKKHNEEEDEIDIMAR